MHWYGRSFTFVDDGQRVLLGVPSLGWTRGQLLDLSEALGAGWERIAGEGSLSGGWDWRNPLRRGRPMSEEINVPDQGYLCSLVIASRGPGSSG